MQAHKRVYLVLLTLVAGHGYGANHTVQVGQNSQGQDALAFNPATLNIAAGDTVTFVNNSGGFHNVDSTGGPTAFKCSVDCAANNAPNSSAWSAVVSFPTAGTVTYQCDQHATLGMTGSITVSPLVPVRLQSFEVD